METFLLNGKAENLASLQPQQSEISLVCKFPKAPVEAKYFSLEDEEFKKEDNKLVVKLEVKVVVSGTLNSPKT